MKTQAQMKTIDEQLEEALARITQLESDATASAALLTESGHQHERFRQEIAALTGEKDALAASTSAAQIAALTAEKETLTLAHAELTGQRDQLAGELATAQQALNSAAAAAGELAKAQEKIAALTAEVTNLKASAKSAERIAAERYGAASPQPLPVTSRGDSKADELVTRFKAISDPAEQTAFWRSLTPEQRTLIQNAR
jgi:chromosome segregation ATPase